MKPTGTISFIVEARLHGKSKRKVLGIWSEEYGADEARADAKLELALWGKGEQGQSEIEGL
ncbi:MAG: hypothetical protein QF515_17490, partial [Pseudomonadales bacterium]|nr:hypothetical protein [Pseudomonadales bacterium]